MILLDKQRTVNVANCVEKYHIIHERKLQLALLIQTQIGVP